MWGVGRTMLEVLNDATRFTPVPFLAETAGLALSIVNSVDVRTFCRHRSDNRHDLKDFVRQRAQGNKEDLSSLARQCAALVYIIKKSFDAFQQVDQIPPELQKDLEHVHERVLKVDYSALRY